MTLPTPTVRYEFRGEDLIPVAFHDGETWVELPPTITGILLSLSESRGALLEALDAVREMVSERRGKAIVLDFIDRVFALGQAKRGRT